MTHSPTTPANPSRGVSKLLERSADHVKMAKAIGNFGIASRLVAELSEALTAAIGAGGQAVGYARAVDVDPASRPFEGRNSFWVSERQNAYYSVPIYLSQPHPADERVVEALPRPDAVSMASGTICLEYVDRDERDLAFDWLEAHGAGAAPTAATAVTGGQ
ncbi:MAG: hypothetical protein WA975_18015 [Mesorhizobium sp.]